MSHDTDTLRTQLSGTMCDNTMDTLWVIINPNYWYENGYNTELHDPMGYNADSLRTQLSGTMGCNTELRVTMCYNNLQK